jgi:N-acetyl-1-D-myo-inositol-2-amino-2-deoxy-alpha-D-glucopyranoside deacetylase
MRAHATQIAVDAPFFALSNGIRHEAFGVECYTLLAGPRGPAGPAGATGSSGPGGRETDLFAQ